MRYNGSTGESPVVEILGPWLLNKGDDLMLRSVVKRLGSEFSLAVSSTLGTDELPKIHDLYEIRWKPELTDLADAFTSLSPQKGLRWARNQAALRLLPASVLRSTGYVAGSSIIALLDCSGFAYGDLWPPYRLKQRAAYYEKLKQQGAVLIMLPQALGPFEDPSTQIYAKALFRHFDLVFVRDEISHQHLVELGVDPDKIQSVPDISHLLSGAPPQNSDSWKARACIVPNARMLDKTTPGVQNSYLNFLVGCINQFRKCGLEPFLLLHEKNDIPLVEDIRKELSFSISVVDEDGEVSKGILGLCHVVLSSRYHALVSALSQGTPALGTSWAHKYAALFEEYGCTECLISPLEEMSEVEKKIEKFVEPRHRNDLSNELKRIAEQQKEKVHAMWNEIEEMLVAKSA